MPSNRQQRNFLPALVLTLVWWLMLGGLVVFVDPQVIADFPFTGSYGLFFLLLFLAVWFLASLILVHTRRGLLVATWCLIFGYLRLGKLGTIINGILLGGALLAAEIYWSSKRLTRTAGAVTTHLDDEADRPAEPVS